MLSLVNACSADDPTVPVTQFVGDSLTLISALASTCDGLSVDLQTDLNSLLAEMVVQGYQPSEPVEAVASQTLPSFSDRPFRSSAVDTEFNGITQEAINSTMTNALALFSDWTNMQADITSGEPPTVEDTAASYDDLWGLAESDGAVWGQLIQAVALYSAPAVTALCNLT